MFKVLKAIHNNIYTANKPEDSSIKRGSKYIARTFFNAVEAVNAKCYVTLGASALAVSAGIATNYIGEENETNHNYASFLIYYGGASLVPIISCGCINFINILHKSFEAELDYICASNSNAPLNLASRQRENSLVELYNNVIPVTRKLVMEAVKIKRSQESLVTEYVSVAIVALSFIDDPVIREQRINLFFGVDIFSLERKKREAKIIAYDELKLYDGDAIDHETLSVISQDRLKDIE